MSSSESTISEARPPITAYWPIATIYVMAIAASLSLKLTFGYGWMNGFMGFTLGIFGLAKLTDLGGFAATFIQYDLIAARFPWYAKAYPFLEVGLAAFFLTNTMFLLGPVLVLTAGLSTLSILGISRSLRQKPELHCSCLGTLLNLPLSGVSLGESYIMLIMALFMLISLRLGSNSWGIM